jgi:putative DNA primase/helicase
MSGMAIDTGKSWEDMSAEERAVFVSVLNADLPRTTDQWLQYLALLTPIDYDRRREAVAKRLSIRVQTLDDSVAKLRPKTGTETKGTILLHEPEPWPSPVDGGELLNAVRAIFEKYAILPAGAAVMLPLWVIHTYLLDASDVSPYVVITSPEKQCGKTIVLQLLQALVYRPLPASNITAAAVFRTIEAFKPTLLIDEADSFMRHNEELRGVLNSGHRRSMAYCIRTTGDNHEPKRFATWCPKAIALIGKLPTTLEDRSIPVLMRRKSRDEKVQRIRDKFLREETAEARCKAVRWARRTISELSK